VLFTLGYAFEVIGDAQLKRHIKKRTHTLMTSGLWKYTRHPNYLGEAFLWWGLYIIVLLGAGPWYLIISPIAITYVLYFISTPLLEQRMKQRDGWEEYSLKTNKFIPCKRT